MIFIEAIYIYIIARSPFSTRLFIHVGRIIGEKSFDGVTFDDHVHPISRPCQN